MQMRVSGKTPTYFVFGAGGWEGYCSGASAVCGGLVAIVLLVSGLLKAVDIPAFRSSLQTWKLIPSTAAEVIAWFIPFLEIGLALRWFMWPKRRLTSGAMLVLLVAVSGAYAAHLIYADPPSCLCFGVMDRFREDIRSTKMVLWRNATLITLAVVGTIWTPEVPCSRPPRASIDSSAKMSLHRRAFSVVEMLLTIAIASIALSVVVPSIQRFRARARVTVDLSNLRQHTAIFAAYGNDYKEIAPYVTRAEWDYTVLRCGDWVQEAPYFYAAFLWPAPLAPGYYEGQCGHRSLASPVTTIRLSLSDYQYACSFVARPEYWRPDTRRDGRSQWGPTRFSQVLWPTRKCLLARVTTGDYIEAVASRRYERLDRSSMSGVPVPLGFVDGSARSIDAPDVLAGYPSGDGNLAASVHTLDFPFALHTLDGVRGFDVQ
jgi:hypothetical protein